MKVITSSRKLASIQRGSSKKSTLYVNDYEKVIALLGCSPTLIIVLVADVSRLDVPVVNWPQKNKETIFRYRLKFHLPSE